MYKKATRTGLPGTSRFSVSKKAAPAVSFDTGFFDNACYFQKIAAFGKSQILSGKLVWPHEWELLPVSLKNLLRFADPVAIMKETNTGELVLQAERK